MDRRRFLAATGAGLLAAAPARAGADPDIALDDLLAASGAPALAGAVVTRQGLAWIGAAGRRRAGAEDPVTVDDLWHLGSNTKAMTAALYARLVRQGVARWGATLAGLFPDLDVHPALADLPVEALLRHRAGLADADLMPGWMAAAWGGGPVTGLRRRMAESALTRAPGGTPGQFAYGNANYIVAGAALERLTGQPWEALMRAELFAPLGMAGAGFGPPLGDQPRGHDAAGRPVDPERPGADNPPALGPAGTVHAGLADYARFLRLFLGEGDGVLDADSLARLTAAPGEAPRDYALGWGVNRTLPWAGPGPALSHDGSNTMWLARAVVAPARGLAVACVSNDFARGRAAVDALTARLMAAFSG